MATALAVLADAWADCRVRLEPIDTAVVLQLLDPATYPNRKTLLPGHVSAAEQAISLWVPKTCATWADALGIAGGLVKRLGVGRAGPGPAGGGMIFGLWA